MLDSSRNYSLEYGAIDLKTGICIALDQVGFEFAVNKEVKAEQLKIMILAFGIQKLERGSKDISAYAFHLLQDVNFKIIMLVRKCCI